MSKLFDEAREKLEEESDRATIKVPDDLEAKVEVELRQRPDITWHRAVRLMVDPDAPDDDDNKAEDDETEDNEDLSDIDE